MFATRTPSTGLIDRYLPQFTFGHRHAIAIVSDDLAEVYAIARDLDLSRSPVVPWLFKLRGLPVSRLHARSFTAAMGWSDLEESAPNEFLIGYRKRGRPEPLLHPHGAAADPPDVTQKVVFSFRFSRQGEQRVLVGTETRVLCIGRAATLRFWPYWLAIKPFSGLIRREILRLIKQEAEQRMVQRQTRHDREGRPTGQPDEQPASPPDGQRLGPHPDGARDADADPAPNRPRPRTVIRLPSVVLAPLRVFFRVSARVWPAASIAVFKWLLSRLPRRPLRPAEQAFLATAERLEFRCGEVGLAGYAFGRGPTVLMVHGLLGSSANFYMMIPALVARGYRVVAVDGLNHGNSPAGSIVSDAPVNQIAEVIRQLGDLHAVVSHSAGAYVTMMALLQFPAGSTLRKCVYLAPFPDLESSLTSFMDYFAVPEHLAPPLRPWFAKIGGRPMEEQSFAACLPLHRTPAAPARLFIHDRDDLHAPAHRTQAWVARDPSSELLLTQGLGHFKLLKDAQVVERVLAFLDDARPPE